MTGVQLNSQERKLLYTLAQKHTWLSIYYYFRAYATILLAILISEKMDQPIITLLAVFFIAARQHSLYVLNHEASHDGLFEKGSINKWVALVFSNIPFFHHPEAWSFVQWKRVHRLHHGKLMTDDDPNYLERKLSGDIGKVFTKKQLLKELLMTVIFSIPSFFRVRQDYVHPSGLLEKRKNNHLFAILPIYKNDREMNIEQSFKLLLMFVLLSLIHVSSMWSVFITYWILPMYTIYPSLLRLMDLTEHNWSENSGELKENTNTRRPSMLEKVFISDLNRSYHWEHHEFPQVPFYNLPLLRERLTINEESPQILNGFLAARQ